MYFTSLLLVLLTLAPALQGIPVTTQSSTNDDVAYALILGEDNVLEYIPIRKAGLSARTAIDKEIVSCGNGDVCVETVVKKSADYASSTILNGFNTLPSYCLAAFGDVTGGLVTGSSVRKTTNSDSATSLSTVSGQTSITLTRKTGSVTTASGDENTADSSSLVSKVLKSSTIPASFETTAQNPTGQKGDPTTASSASTSSRSTQTSASFSNTGRSILGQTRSDTTTKSTSTGLSDPRSSRTTLVGPVSSASEGRSPSSSNSKSTAATRSDSSEDPALAALANGASSISGPKASTTSRGTKQPGSATAESTETGSTKAAPGIKSQTRRAATARSTGISSAVPLSVTPVAFAIQATNSQGSVFDEIVVVGTDGSAITNTLSDYRDDVSAIITALPAGASIETITTSKCISDGQLVTTTSKSPDGNTIETVVPEICYHGLAFFIFGLPGFNSGSDLAALCHKSFSFILGLVFRLLCPNPDSVTPIPPTFVITGIDPVTFPENEPGGNKNGDPNDNDPNDNDPEKTADKEQTQTNPRNTATIPSAASPTRLSTVSSSATAMPTRYMIVPIIGTPQTTIDALFTKYASRSEVTKSTRNDGSLKLFALPLSDAEASSIDPSFIVVAETELEIQEPDAGQDDPDLNGANYSSLPFEANPNPGAQQPSNRRLRARGKKNRGLFKRFDVAGWAEKITWWTLAMISLAPGIAAPEYKMDEASMVYPYYYANAVEPGKNVRVYLLDTGLNMGHPEFKGRWKEGVAEPQNQNDYDIDWLFPSVDREEFFMAPGQGGGPPTKQKYTYNYIDPTSEFSGSGMHPAYTDYRAKKVDTGALTPHGTRLSAFIMGDTLGQAQKCRYTVARLPQYTNGPRTNNALFPLWGVAEALIMITNDIEERMEQGEKVFVVCSSLGFPFADRADSNPPRAQKQFEGMWQHWLDWFNENGITIIASSGNSAPKPGSPITLSPARMIKKPGIVVGSVTPAGKQHPKAQGFTGDGILTVYAPGPGARVVSSDENDKWNYEFIPVLNHAVTSYATGITVGYVAYMLGLAYNSNEHNYIPLEENEKPHDAAYRIVTTYARPVVENGPAIIYNGAPIEIYQQCGGPGGYAKRDGACKLGSGNIELPSGSNALPPADVGAILAGNGAQIAGTPIPDPNLGLGGQKNGPGGTNSKTYTGFLTPLVSKYTTTIDPHPPTSLIPKNSPLTTHKPPTSSAPPPAASIPPNVAIAIWEQLYTSLEGAEVASWQAYKYTPGDSKLGDACSSGAVGYADVPDGTFIGDLPTLLPGSLDLKAYDKKYTFVSQMGLLGSFYPRLLVKGTQTVVVVCRTLGDVEGKSCNAQYELTPRATCEWFDPDEA